MSLLTLAAGVLVLLAALQITGEQRRFESALLRALGATGARVRRLARHEFGRSGLSPGHRRRCGHRRRRVRRRGPVRPRLPVQPRALLAGVVVGVVTVWAAGGIAARRYYRVSPMRLLREGD
ncbi:MAG: hypothetical protein U5L11_15215 [Arhodomonas sp.]|nr:hypothetical protein [Arhodomonas sp.]